MVFQKVTVKFQKQMSSAQNTKKTTKKNQILSSNAGASKRSPNQQQSASVQPNNYQYQEQGQIQFGEYYALILPLQYLDII